MCGKLPFYQGLIWWLSSKESTYQCRRRQFNPWVRKIPWRRARLPIPVLLGFAGGSDGKESTCSTGGLASIPGLGRFPGGGHGNLLQYSCLENPHGQRSLVGYSPWGRKESDTTERLSTTQHTGGKISLGFIKEVREGGDNS